MANDLYAKAREKFATAQINWTTATIKVLLIDTGAYTPDLTNHEFLSSVPAPARIAGSAALTNKTATNGILDADNVTFSAVTGVQSEALLLYIDTGSDSTSSLVMLIDTGSGLPITPNGGDIIVTWDNGVNRIMKL